MLWLQTDFWPNTPWPQHVLNWFSPITSDDSAALMQLPKSPLTCRQLFCRCLPGLQAAAGEEMPRLSSSQQSPSGNRDLLNPWPATLALQEHGERREPPVSPSPCAMHTQPGETGGRKAIAGTCLCYSATQRQSSRWHLHVCHSPKSENYIYWSKL